MTPAQIIASVRRLVQDAVVPYRYSDATLLGYVNQTLQRIAVIRPDLFSRVEVIPTVAGSAVQTLPAGALRLIDIFQIADGNAVTEVDRETMARNYPGWMTEAAGQPVNFMRHGRNPIQYFLYPRPAAGVSLVADFAAIDGDFGLNDEITPLPEAYFPTVVDGVVFLAESIDDEHVNSGRAKLFLDSFVQQLGASLQSRSVTDTKMAGMPKGEVI